MFPPGMAGITDKIPARAIKLNRSGFLPKEGQGVDHRSVSFLSGARSSHYNVMTS